MVVDLMYLNPRELFNIGGLQDKEHIDQTFRGILRILNKFFLNHSNCC